MFQRFVPEIRCPYVTALLSSDGMIFPPSVLRPQTLTGTERQHRATSRQFLRTYEHIYTYIERERENDDQE